MLNREKYAKEILDIACTGDNVAMRKSNNVIVGCKELKCSDCAFNPNGKGYCNDMVEKWANSEYVEPPVDWSKVAVDTPILVRDTVGGRWSRRYFAKYEDGIVYAWENGATSWSAHRGNITDWGMAKLAESEEKND
jgi:hypothetical protein